MDCGSQRTYISQQLVDKLQLKSHKTEKLSVHTFGSGKAKIITTPVVKLQVKLLNSSTADIYTNIVPQIASSIKREAVNIKELKNYKGTELADTLPGATEISNVNLLIGNDYYYHFVKSEKIELCPGLYLISSKFEWILTGRYKDEEKGPQQTTLSVIVPD